MKSLLDDGCHAALKYGVGMAPFLNDLMRVTGPDVRRKAERYRPQFVQDEQFYWLVRAATNYILDVGRGFDAVIGIAVVFHSGVVLSVFTDDLTQAANVNRKAAIASYKFRACVRDKHTWLLKIEEESLDEQ